MNRRQFMTALTKGGVIVFAVPSVLYSCSTETSRQTNETANMDINKTIECLKQFTDAYLKYSNNPGRREVACMRIQYPLWLRPIQKGDVFAGRGEFDHAIGFSPQPFCNKLGYYLKEDQLESIRNHPELLPENREVFDGLVAYWKAEETAVKTRQAYPPEMKKALPTDNWTGEPGVGFPLYRMSGTQMDYDKLLTIGIDGLEQEIAEKQKRVSKLSAQANLYQNMMLALDLFREVCHYYANMAAGQQKKSSNPEQLVEMERILRKVANRPPETTREAIQLSYLYCQFSGS